MSSVTAQFLSLSETIAPLDESEVAATVREAASEHRPIYPVGGATRLAFGAWHDAVGIGLHTTGMDRVIDHAADDMTITVEAGITLSQLASVLAQKGQRLPVDVPQPARATIGGVIATNTFGPRRFGYRTIRDYVIGLRAVDGQGEAFGGGGRVVKNAAGYDMPRLLVGSMGTLGVITQLSLMVRPAAEMAAMVVARLPDLDAAECLLAQLAQSPARPISVDFLNSEWGGVLPETGGAEGGPIRLLVGFEGSRTEVEWMVDGLRREWKNSSAREVRVLDGPDTVAMWQWMTDLPTHVQANVLPSRVAALIRSIAQWEPRCAVAAHAGDGIVKVRLPDELAHDLPAVLASRLRPAVEQLDGILVVVSAPPGCMLTQEDVWGPARRATSIMQAIKKRFDPQGILNPGRWVF